MLHYQQTVLEAVDVGEKRLVGALAVEDDGDVDVAGLHSNSEGNSAKSGVPDLKGDSVVVLT